MRKDLTTGSVTKTILTTAMPLILALLLQTGFNIVDAIYVGRISAEAIAAVSLAFPIMFFIFAVAGGVGVGATSLIARYIGSKKFDKADNVAEHALLAGLVLGLLFTIFGFWLGRPLVVSMGADSIADLTLEYLNVIFIGTVFMMIFIIGNNIFRGEGDTKTPMKFMMIATITNIILDPIFIFTLGYGVKGAAIATIISNFFGFGAVMLGFMNGKSSVKIRPRHFKYDFKIIKKIFAIGIPSSLSQISMSLSLGVMMKIISTFGTYAVAAYGIIFRLDSIAILPALGLMMAVIPIIGQNVGAKKFDRAEKSAYRTAIMAGIFTGLVGLIFFSFPRLFISIFNTTPEVIGFGVLYLRTVTLVYAFIGIGISMGGSFLGAGHPMPALITTLLRVIILLIPLSLLLAFTFNLGILGVWLAVSISILASSITAIFWFRTGSWKKDHIKKENIPSM
ncbi:MAG: MATE family efflux transporter [Nanoarchaeota archaeon]|nr:MATE family efflux transporter [Nanoarchaeota archaeon]MBU1704231.1 MATE family efflux transporter [Nanoarchaeota archaeon]